MEKVTNGIKVDLDLLRSRLLKDNLLSLAILLSAPLQVRCCYLDLYKCGNMLNEKLTQRRTSQMQQQNLRPLDAVVATGEKLLRMWAITPQKQFHAGANKIRVCCLYENRLDVLRDLENWGSRCKMKHLYFSEHENTFMFCRKYKLSPLYPIWGQIRISSMWIKENQEIRFELICWTQRLHPTEQSKAV